MTACTHQSPRGTMCHLPLSAQRDLGKAGEAEALAGALEVCLELPKFCAQYPSPAVVGTRGMSKCTGQVDTTAVKDSVQIKCTNVQMGPVRRTDDTADSHIHIRCICD